MDDTSSRDKADPEATTTGLPQPGNYVYPPPLIRQLEPAGNSPLPTPCRPLAFMAPTGEYLCGFEPKRATRLSYRYNEPFCRVSGRAALPDNVHRGKTRAHSTLPATAEGFLERPTMIKKNDGTIATKATASIIEAVCQELENRGESDDLVGKFAKLFLRKAPIDFLEERSTETLATLVLGSFQYLQNSEPDKVNVDLENLADDEWPLPVTAIRTHVTERPFIVNTVREFLHSRDIGIEGFLHPVMHVKRDDEGNVVSIEPGTAGQQLESLVYCEVPRISDPETMDEIRGQLITGLEDVVYATDDFEDMSQALSETLDYLEQAAKEHPDRKEEVQEVQDFLRWLLDESFIFLGYRAYTVTETDEGPALVVEPGSGLGILRKEQSSGFCEPVALEALRPEVRERLASGPLLLLSKTNAESTVHRRARMDYIGIKKLDPEGRVIGERRFIGLLSSRGYAEEAEEIPILRKKLQEIIEQAGYIPGSHDYKETITTFNTMSKEWLFLASPEEIGQEIEAILARYHTQDIKVTLRRDPLGRGVSIMVIMPRERYSGRARRALQAELLKQYQGTLLHYHLVMGGGNQARLHLFIATAPDRMDALTAEQIEQKLSWIVQTWTDRLEAQLSRVRPGFDARRVAQRWGAAFSLEYQAATSPADAVGDIAELEAMAAEDRSIALRLLNPMDPELVAGGELVTQVKVMLRGSRLTLSDFMPILEHAGLRVIAMSPYEVACPDGCDAIIYDFIVQDPDGDQIDLERSGEMLAALFLAVRAGNATSDRLNTLVLSADLTWREVCVLRALSEFAFQIKSVPSRPAMITALREHPEIAARFIQLFKLKFDPALDVDMEERKQRLEEMRKEYVQALDQVSSLANDRALRTLLAVLEAVVRTSYFARGGADPAVDAGASCAPGIAFKFLGELLQPLAKNQLHAEIWVYSARMAGAHMRSALVARGGLRHSDRPDDFHSEVLELVTTQAIKNSVIVPGGSKGGFIVRPPRTPEVGYCAKSDVETQYRAFIGGLLDITDNLVDDEPQTPPGVVPHDGPDPYLVVAADKGTATFSDVANSVAEGYSFWLGDAFASGGSIGYDHKLVGITAKSSWESVKRHFREMGTDTQTEPFTVIGIGDMSGDVFGNGMLLSRKIRLVAAFDHRHIFVDPDPDPETSYVERERMFKLPSSSWEDYNKDLLSEGGFVAPRSAKSIRLSTEAQDALGLPPETTELSGEALIRAVLRAPVDLLWNGGIGTYVKASDETHAEVGDTANNAVRIDATELRCKVLGEGGNLGLTQRARIEFALKGGCCYTDALDNAGGVALSDREVNLKILLDKVLAEGRMEREERNKMLLDLTNAVRDKVLVDTRSQGLAVSMDELRAEEATEDFHAFMLAMEKRKLLDRAANALPSLDDLTERQQQGRTLLRPELSVLLSYAKQSLKQDVLDSNLPDDPALDGYVLSYFPAEAIEIAGSGPLESHRLRREIITTMLCNDLVDLMGATFVHRMIRDTGQDAAAVARAWFISAQLCGARELRDRVDQLEGKVASTTIYRWLMGLARVLERTSRWVLANIDPDVPAGQIIDSRIEGLRKLRGTFDEVVAGAERELFEARVQEIGRLTDKPDLAQTLITLRFLDQLLEVLKIAEDTGHEPMSVGRGYYLVSELLDVPKLRQAIIDAAGRSRWDQRAAQALIEDLASGHRQMTDLVLAELKPKQAVDEVLDQMTGAWKHKIDEFRALVDEIAAEKRVTLPALSVAIRALRSISED